jgi:hypothetical protein
METREVGIVPALQPRLTMGKFNQGGNKRHENKTHN